MDQIRLLLYSPFWSTLFASIFNLLVMLGNYLQQTTSADDIFRCIFFLALYFSKGLMLLVNRVKIVEQCGKWTQDIKLDFAACQQQKCRQARTIVVWSAPMLPNLYKV